MAETSKIEWSNATWNPITGCTIVSAGCQNCYAMRLAGGRLKNHSSRSGLTTETPNGPVWNGAVRFNENWLDQPTIWRTPKMIFVVAHGDLFHEKVPFEWIDRLFYVMRDERCAHHTFQVLTKRPERMKVYLTSPRPTDGRPNTIDVLNTPLPPSIWLGTSAEDQESANKRIPMLPYVHRPITWLSAEPLLGPIKLGHMVELLDWVVIGGESGPHARPMELQWAADLILECQENGVAVFMKQLSQASDPLIYKAFDASWPSELLVREYPKEGMA